MQGPIIPFYDLFLRLQNELNEESRMGKDGMERENGVEGGVRELIEQRS